MTYENVQSIVGAAVVRQTTLENLRKGIFPKRYSDLTEAEKDLIVQSAQKNTLALFSQAIEAGLLRLYPERH